MSLEEWRYLPRRRLATSPSPQTTRLIDAAVQGRRVQIIYYSGTTPGKERWVRPIQVFAVDQTDHVYLEAYCELRQGTRCFRLDRLRLVTGSAASNAFRELPTKAGRDGYVTVFLVALVGLALLAQCGR